MRKVPVHKALLAGPDCVVMYRRYSSPSPYHTDYNVEWRPSWRGKDYQDSLQPVGYKTWSGTPGELEQTWDGAAGEGLGGDRGRGDMIHVRQNMVKDKAPLVNIIGKITYCSSCEFE